MFSSNVRRQVQILLQLPESTRHEDEMKDEGNRRWKYLRNYNQHSTSCITMIPKKSDSKFVQWNMSSVQGGQTGGYFPEPERIINFVQSEYTWMMQWFSWIRASTCLVYSLVCFEHMSGV
jgi:hypothetical protein